MRRLPVQSHRRRLALELGIVQPERIHAAAQQPDGRHVIEFIARLDPGVDQRLVHVVDPQPGPVVRFQAEFVLTCFFGEHAALPLDGKFVLADLGRIGALAPELKGNLRIDPLDHLLVAAKVAGVIVRALQAAFLVPLAFTGKTADQVGGSVQVLPHRQMGQFDAGRFVPCAVGLGIECVEDVLSDPLGLFADALFRFVLRHRVVDVLRQLRQRSAACQGIAVVARHTFAMRAVAFGTQRLVELLPGRNGLRRTRIAGKQHRKSQERRGEPGSKSSALVCRVKAAGTM